MYVLSVSPANVIIVIMHGKDVTVMIVIVVIIGEKYRNETAR